MGATLEYITHGVKFVSRLDSFPVFCGYVLLVLLAGFWKRFTSPLSLRPVSPVKFSQEGRLAVRCLGLKDSTGYAKVALFSQLAEETYREGKVVELSGLYKKQYQNQVQLAMTHGTTCQVLVVYNLTASAISLYTFYGFCTSLYHADSTFERQTSDQLKYVYKIYWLVKTFELLDTVFMVLRHKQRQISFLHVYHHGSMLLLSDISYNFYPYVSVAMYLGLNSAVHVLLYLYYGLSALYPDNPPQWKKVLTQFQIGQFIIDLAHASLGYLYHNHCIYGIFYCLAMIILFSNFYLRAYSKKQSSLSTSGTETIKR